MTCGNNVLDPGEICDNGSNLGTAGCAIGCKSVTCGWNCPPLGTCTNKCGDGIYLGTDPVIGMVDTVNFE